MLRPWIKRFPLKTPLASIKGSVQFFRRRAQSRPSLPLRETEMELLQVMDHQVNRLVRLVSDLTQYSVLQTGRLGLFRTRFSLGALAREVIAGIQVAEPDCDLRILVQDETTVEADAERMEQVLYNLISNALRLQG